MSNEPQAPQQVHGQPCPMCLKNGLTLTEAEREIPFFGKVYLFSMACTECKYFKADIECQEKREPSKYTLEVDSVDDLNIRIIKSASATVKIPHVMTIESAETSNGYITNVEGLLNRVKRMLEASKEEADDSAARKKIKNMLKKLHKVVNGYDKLKIIIEDKTGNSAIVSQKAKKSKIKA